MSTRYEIAVGVKGEYMASKVDRVEGEGVTMSLDKHDPKKEAWDQFERARALLKNYIYTI